MLGFLSVRGMEKSKNRNLRPLQKREYFPFSDVFISSLLQIGNMRYQNLIGEKRPLYLGDKEVFWYPLFLGAFVA